MRFERATPVRRRSRRALGGLVLAGLLAVAAACGGDDDDTAEPAAATGDTAAGDTAPDENTPDETAPDETAPDETAPATVAPATVAGAEAPETTSAAAPPADGVAYATQRVEQFLTVPSTGFAAPGAPIAGDVGSLAGTTVWFVPINFNAIPFFSTFVTGMEDAFSQLGIEVRVCDGAGTPGTIGACIDDAAAQQAGAVVTGSVSPYLAERSFENARDAGVPVLVTNQGYPEPSTNELAYLSFDTNELLRLAADWVIADSGGDATILLTRITDSEWTQAAIDEGAVAELEQYCPGCTYEIVDLNFGSVDQMASSVAAAFARNPEIDYVIPQYTSVVPMVLEGVRQAGFADKVRAVTATGVLDGVQRVHDQDVILAEVGINIYQQGWMAADQVIRMMLGEEPLQELDVPFRMFTEANVGELELTPEAFQNGDWYGDTGFREVYLDLWGVEGS